jgi:hypothetical protein
MSPAALGDCYSSPKLVNGAMYWSVTAKSCLTKLVRFNLATEDVTLELIEFRPSCDQTPFSPVFSVLEGLDARVCLMTEQRDAVFIGEGARRAGGIAEP